MLELHEPSTRAFCELDSAHETQPLKMTRRNLYNAKPKYAAPMKVIATISLQTMEKLAPR